MTWLAVLGSMNGRRPALAAVAGIALGLAVAGAIAALGLTVVFDQYPGLITVLRVAGTLYLLFLAYESWTDAARPDALSIGQNRSFFAQGFISNTLNPKAYLFYAAILPEFISSDGSRTQDIFTFSAIYVAIATTIHGTIAVLSGSIASWLAQSPQATLLRRALAAMMVGAAVWFFLSTAGLK